MGCGSPCGDQYGVWRRRSYRHGPTGAEDHPDHPCGSAREGTVASNRLAWYSRPYSITSTASHTAATAFRTSSSSRPSGSISASLSYRDVEDMLAERGIDVSYETVDRGPLSSAPSLHAS